MATKNSDPAAGENPPAASTLTEDEAAELVRLREENAALAAQNDQIAAENDELRAAAADGVTLTTDAAPSAADQRRTQALHEQAVMDRSEGARQDREQQANMAAASKAGGRPIASALRSDGAVEDDADSEA